MIETKTTLEKRFPRMSEEQRAYLIAKTNSDAVREFYQESVAEFIKDSGYKNPDGSVPKNFYSIKNSEVFLNLYEAYEQLPENVWNQVYKAEQFLRKSEDRLIDVLIKAAPEDKKAKINQVRYTLGIREKLIDLAMQMKTAVPANK